MKAVLLNLLSVGGTYGVLVLVWQQGHGSQAIWNTPATGAITNFVPLMVFAFLFGLSMDYEVFILSRIREEHDAGASTLAAIVEGPGGAPAGSSPAPPSSSPSPSSRCPRHPTPTSKSSPPAWEPASCLTPPSSAHY